MDKLGFQGTIKVFGSPAEETLISRPYMIRAGFFDDVDAVIDNHSGSGFGTSYGVGGNALFSVIFNPCFEYFTYLRRGCIHYILKLCSSIG